jgi:hypothetical protein
MVGQADKIAGLPRPWRRGFLACCCPDPETGIHAARPFNRHGETWISIVALSYDDRLTPDGDVRGAPDEIVRRL